MLDRALRPLTFARAHAARTVASRRSDGAGDLAALILRIARKSRAWQKLLLTMALDHASARRAACARPGAKPMIAIGVLAGRQQRRRLLFAYRGMRSCVENDGRR